MTALIGLTLLTGAGGLALGAGIGVWIGSTSKKFDAVMLSFSAGSMIALICFELLHEALETEVGAPLVAAAVLFGAGLVAYLDYVADRRSGHSQDFITCEDCDEEFMHDVHHTHCDLHEADAHRHEHGAQHGHGNGQVHGAAHEAHGNAADAGHHSHHHAHNHLTELFAAGKEAGTAEKAAAAEKGAQEAEAAHAHRNAPEEKLNQKAARIGTEAAQMSEIQHGGLRAEGEDCGAEQEEAHSEHHHKKTSHLQLMLAGIMMAVAIAIHNIPEGMSVGAVYAREGSAVNSALLALIASIVLHNIPEGMAVALPLYTSGMTRRRAVLIAAVSGLPTLFGALIGYGLGDMGPYGMAVSLGAAAGTLLYVVFGEVLPQSINLYCSRKTAFAAITGLVAGMLILGTHVH